MHAWIDTSEPVLGRIADVSRELSDPIRLTVMQLLAYEGPHGMGQLARVLRVSPSRLGNHLVRLRDTGLVTTRRSGRSVIYEVADPRIRPLLDQLAAFADSAGVAEPDAEAVGVLCKDHLAGSLGVGVLDALLDRDAVRYRDDPRDGLELGRNATREFARFGVEVTAATDTSDLLEPCLDREVRRPHLGGRLGNEVLRSLRRRHLIRQASAHIVPVRSRRAEFDRLVPRVGLAYRPDPSDR